MGDSVLVAMCQSTVILQLFMSMIKGLSYLSEGLSVSVRDSLEGLRHMAGLGLLMRCDERVTDRERENEGIKERKREEGENERERAGCVTHVVLCHSVRSV